MKSPVWCDVFPFHQKDPKYQSTQNLSLISHILFLHPLSWERRWLGRAVFWWWSVLKYCFRNIHRILTPTAISPPPPLPQFSRVVVWYSEGHQKVMIIYVATYMLHTKNVPTSKRKESRRGRIKIIKEFKRDILNIV